MWATIGVYKQTKKFAEFKDVLGTYFENMTNETSWNLNGEIMEEGD